jgi:hypothetical protein
MAKQTQQLLLMLIIGVLIGIAVVKAFSSSKVEAPVLATATESTTASTTEEVAAPALPETPKVISAAKDFPLPPVVPANTRVGITVGDQPAKKSVAVTEIAVKAMSWIAIYDEREGKPGSILGAQRVNPEDTATTVELLRREGTVAGQKYYAAILPDNGDGVFDRLTDLPPFSPEKVVIVSFLAK